MNIAGIDFPDPILSALRDDRLVIFAGAGVSKGQPAGLPNFHALVQKIAQGTGKLLGDGVALDQFLGSLADSGINVHRRASEALTRDGTQPAPLHHELLRCFGRPDSIRIVTTNFDELFELAGAEALKPGLEIHTSPGLPLGTDFTGVVHLHGSVARPESMTLTDRDFGRAYITNGRTGQFLVDLFRTFTVLFVGYSHDDVVMSYLARSLSDIDHNPPTRQSDMR